MEYIFVYGVFRDYAKKLLGDSLHCGRSSIKGKLYKVNDFYPGWVPGDEGEVWGDVYLINPEILPILDEFEGSEYKRVKVKTKNDIECWVYEYVLDVTNFEEIKSGDWFLR